MSPTQRSLAVLKKKCGLYQIVEHWNAFCRRRIDLFGCIDILFLGEDNKTYAIQVTSGAHHAERVKKLLNDNGKKVDHMKRCGWIVMVHSWSKKKVPGQKRETWQLREEIL